LNCDPKFEGLTPVANVIKLFTVVIYETRAFIDCKLFQLSLTFANKAGDYAREVPFRSTTLELVLVLTHKH
jgi:hypothetical protein